MVRTNKQKQERLEQLIKRIRRRKVCLMLFAHILNKSHLKKRVLFSAATLLFNLVEREKFKRHSLYEITK